MSETSSHKRAKEHAAGKSDGTEKKIKYGGRIDVLAPTKAVEIDREEKNLQQVDFLLTYSLPVSDTACVGHRVWFI